MLLKVSENALQRHEEQAGNVTETQQCTSLPSSDPGLRCHNLSANQKKYLIAQGPQQPKLSKFPPKQSIPTSKQRQLSASWYNEYPHLEYSVAKGAVFCFICSLFHKEGQLGSCLVWNGCFSMGEDEEQRGKLAEHFSSKSHKQALSAYVSFCKPLSHVGAMLDKALRNSKIQEAKDKLENKEIIKILLDIVNTLARQNMAFRGDGKENDRNFCQIVRLVSRHCSLLER